MASPRDCCAGEKDEVREAAAHGRTRVEREQTAFDEAACRDNILKGSCAQLSRGRGLTLELSLVSELFGRGVDVDDGYVSRPIMQFGLQAS